MIRYVAFLRAINVGGRKLIKMKELARFFESAGFKNVRTFIQSGNVIFHSRSGNPATVTKKIERMLKQALGYEVTVMLRTLDEIQELVRRNPFKKTPPSADVMMLVVFLAHEPKSKPNLPLLITKENLEIFEVRNRAAFILARRKKTGWFGFPNIEKELGVAGTARNWTTVRKIVDFAIAPNGKGIERTKKR
jgi:uncharacterized protein (DUF1697 family)